MKKLWIYIYDNQEEYSEWLEVLPVEVEEFSENKTLFVQKVMRLNEECLKIKVDCGDDGYETYYYPTSRYSIKQVEISE